MYMAQYTARIILTIPTFPAAANFRRIPLNVYLSYFPFTETN